MCNYRIFKWYSCDHEEKRRKECAGLRLGACGGNVEFLNIQGQCGRCIRGIYQVIELTDYDNPNWDGVRTFKDVQIGSRHPRYYFGIQDVYLAAGEIPKPHKDAGTSEDANAPIVKDCADAKPQSVRNRNFSDLDHSWYFNFSDSEADDVQAKRKRTTRMPRRSHGNNEASGIEAEGSQANRRRPQPPSKSKGKSSSPSPFDWGDYFGLK